MCFLCLTPRLSTASSWSFLPVGPSSTPLTPSRTTWASTRYSLSIPLTCSCELPIILMWWRKSENLEIPAVSGHLKTPQHCRLELQCVFIRFASEEGPRRSVLKYEEGQVTNRYSQQQWLLHSEYCITWVQSVVKQTAQLSLKLVPLNWAADNSKCWGYGPELF